MLTKLFVFCRVCEDFVLFLQVSCAPGMVVCPNGYQCAVECDGTNDCDDNSDESACACKFSLIIFYCHINIEQLQLTNLYK